MEIRVQRKHALWLSGKHFLAHVILHSLATLIGRWRKRERKSQSFRGSGEILKDKSVIGESLCYDRDI